MKIRVFSDFTFYNWLKVSEIFYQIIVLIEASNFRRNILVQFRIDRASQAIKIAESVRVNFNPLGMNLNSKNIYVKKYTYNPNLHNFFNLEVRDFMDTLYIKNL